MVLRSLQSVEEDAEYCSELWKDVTILATLVVLPPQPELAPKLGIY